MKNLHIDEFGTKRWTNKENLPHRDEDDLHAVEYRNGNKFWYKNGCLYRDNGLPAAIWSNGDQLWYSTNNKLCCRYDSRVVHFLNYIEDYLL